MKQLLIVANWKSNKTLQEASIFIEKFQVVYEPREDAKVIICPPFISVELMSRLVRNDAIAAEIGVQNISPFEDGAYTGEVSAHQAAEFAKFAIIGHSERRTNFGEDDDLLSKKVSIATSFGLIPIFCVQNENTFIPDGVKVVAYEPPSAIGTGQADTPESAEHVALIIKEKHGEVAQVLYGGSVVPENVSGFTKMEHISGVLIGGASLDPDRFSSIIKQC